MTNTISILLAEDNEFNKKVGLAMLKRLGFSAVDTAKNGQDVLDKCAQQDYDLILMDCEMPVLDGYGAAEQLRQREQSTGRHTLIIAATAHTLAEDRERCLQAGMDDYLAKPFKLDSLTALFTYWRITVDGRL